MCLHTSVCVVCLMCIAFCLVVIVTQCYRCIDVWDYLFVYVYIYMDRHRYCVCVCLLFPSMCSMFGCLSLIQIYVFRDMYVVRILVCGCVFVYVLLFVYWYWLCNIMTRVWQCVLLGGNTGNRLFWFYCCMLWCVSVVDDLL